MARYRAGLNLALPVFDTCGCLARFARNPNSSAALLSYHCLRRRAERELLYGALSVGGSLSRARLLLCLRTGISEDEIAKHLLPYEGDEQSVRPAPKIDATNVDEIYAQLCRQFGYALDLSDSMSASTGAQ